MTRAAICDRLELVRPSRSRDKISDETARALADNNIAIEEGCEPGAAK